VAGGGAGPRAGGPGGGAVIPVADRNPTRRRPVVTVTLIVVCVLVYLGQLAHGFEELVLGLGVVPAVLGGRAELAPELVLVPAPLTLLTYQFVHGGLVHLAGNMLYLWIFGNNVEDRLGPLPFLAFYLGSGVAAGLLHLGLDPASEVPMVGASGAISGVLAAYLLWFPRARVLVVIPVAFLFTLWLPASVLIGVWLVVQVLGAITAGGEGGVAWWAHLGGFAAGLLVAALVGRPRASRRPGPWG